MEGLLLIHRIHCAFHGKPLNVLLHIFSVFNNNNKKEHFKVLHILCDIFFVKFCMDSAPR